MTCASWAHACPPPDRFTNDALSENNYYNEPPLSLGLPPVLHACGTVRADEKGSGNMEKSRLKRLTGYEKKIAKAIAETMAPPGCGFNMCAADVDTVSWLDDYIQKSIVLLRVGAFYLFSLIEFCPLLFGFGPRRFSALSFEERDLYLNRWRDLKVYPLNMTVVVVRLLIALSFYQDDRVLIELGYDLPRMLELASSEQGTG